MKYIYKGQEVKNLITGAVIVKPGDEVEGELVQISPGNVMPCFVAPCPSSDPEYGIMVKNKAGSTALSVDDLTRADGGLMDKKRPTGFLASIRVDNKTAIVTGVAVLFLLALYFNKQVRAFFNA